MRIHDSRVSIAYQVLISSLQSAEYPSTQSHEKYIPSLYNDSESSIIRLMRRAAQLHALWHNSDTSYDNPQDLLYNALDLNTQFGQWETELPPAWICSKQDNTSEAQLKYSSTWQESVLKSRGAPKEIHTFSSFRKSHIWGIYRASRMFLLRDILEILNRIPRLPELRQVCTSITTELVDLIEDCCSAVLYSLTALIDSGPPADMITVRGYAVVWPLNTVHSILIADIVPVYEAPLRPLATNGLSWNVSSMQSGLLANAIDVAAKREWLKGILRIYSTLFD
ncbi:hypothetical protein GQ44DRAFT_779614 [Phaeosphaeriaceae sp. PMI808]|nr:hypothetical protein GQ44DRAFT_779614 [Phaeosphaeriaceae sp. PMI808]